MRHFYQKNISAKSFLLACLVWFASQQGFGQVTPVGIPDNTGNTFTGLVAVTGPNPSDPLVITHVLATTYTPQAGEQGKSIKNVITLSLKEETTTYLPNDFTVTVMVEINYGPDAQHLTFFRNQAVPLTVGYSAATGTKYNAKAYYVFSDAQYVSVKVTGISPSPAGALASNVHVEDLISLSNDMQVVRYFDFDPANSPVTFGIITASDDQLNLAWGPGSHPNGYQVEWAWVEDELASGLSGDALFRDNSTRVDLSCTQFSYAIPLLYDGVGTLHYRVRAVNYNTDGSRDDGAWTEGVYNFNGHESSLNWQVTTNFAENGKRKTVIQYADGSLRTRQTVTKDNVNNTVVTAETLYDGEGRPAIQILPSPGIEDAIRYRQGLNLFNGQASNVDPTGFFDVEASTGSGTPPLMTVGGGAANYYSPLNPEINIGPNKNIPDAEGFPFTQTIYTPDGTGRIQAQGGVGPNHQIESGKETKYYYGNAQQDELDALFGTEAGNAKHYFKNMVKDANGQLSVSYVDMHGRTVATALAGAGPTNLTQLSSNSPGVAVTRQLLDATTNIIRGSSVESVNSLVVSSLQDYNFAYELTPDALQMSDCASPNPAPLCYECKYDLEISIVDPSGSELPVVRNFTNLSLPLTDACPAASGPFTQVTPDPGSQAVIDNHKISFSQRLGIGSYIVRKTLAISESSLQTFKDLYITKALCKSEQDIIDSVQSAMLVSSGCSTHVNVDCQSCQAELGSPADYRNAYLTKLGITDPSPEMLVQIDAERAAAIDKCKLLCTDVSHELPGIREMMEEDMKPYTGQYSLTTPMSDPHSMYDKYNVSITSDATISSHPEYQRLLFAESLQSTTQCYDWITKFNQADYTEAQLPANNYMDPMTSDPLWTVSTDLKNDMQAEINNYGSSGTSMWQIAYGDVRCKTKTDDADRQSCYTIIASSHTDFNSSALALTADEKAQVWNLFKGLYAAQRARLLNKYIATQRPLPGMDEADLAAQGYHIWFPSSDQVTGEEIGLQNSIPSFWPTEENYPENTVTIPAGNTVQDEYAGRCDSYINMWKDRLLECPTLASMSNHDQIITDIVNGMKAVCINGSDQSNPYGSSSVSPSTPGSVTDRNFEDVIKRVFGANGLYTNNKYIDGLCNPFVIEWPKPYGANPKMTGGEMTGQVDDCNCDQFSKLKQAAIAANVDVSSYTAFNNFLQANYNQGITIGMFEGLQHCEQTVTCAACKPLQEAVEGFYASLSGTAEASCINYPTTLQISSRAGNTPAAYEASISIEFLPGFETFAADSFLTAIHPCTVESVCQQQFTQYFNAYFSDSTASSWSQIEARYALNGISLSDLCTYRPVSCTLLHTIECLFKAQGGSGQQRSSIDCTTAFTNFFNTYFHNTVNYTWADLVTAYAYQDCDNNLENTVCNGGAVPGGCPESTSKRIALSHEEPLPDLLKCGYALNSSCLTCQKITAYTNEFTSIFESPANALPFFTGTVELTPEQIAQNENFARFINYRTGFNFTWKDYAEKLAASACILTDDNSTAVQKVICADPTPLTQAPETTIDPCAAVKLQAEAIGRQIYQERRAFLIDQMENAYRQKCLSTAAIESFTVNYINREYHYTLYYYDMAGNLVKTVAPAGVKLLTGSDLTAVATSRLNGYDVPHPAIHSFATSYRYNSLNQVIAQNTPDAGTSNFWYDRLGKLVVSQNAQQAADNNYSYTLYDDLERIKEVGQKPSTTPMSPDISGSASLLNGWIYDGVNNKEQVTRTTYDTKSPTLDPSPELAEIDQQNLRNRVSFSQYFDVDPDNGVVVPGDPNYTDHSTATYYSYDVHGNVDVLLQDYKGLPAMYNITIEDLRPNRFKKIAYHYDLISGKVNDVMYQPGLADAFYHHYDYDAENRIVGVKTSRDQVIWEKDARYEYYKHGPLSRTILGAQQVQGIDYAYTLQGWLKGINSTSGNNSFDLTQDGSANSPVAADVYGFALHYYDDGAAKMDYKPIGGTAVNSFARPPVSIGFNTSSLFNGNIAGITMNFNFPSKKPASTNPSELFYGYRYDQLNRLVSMRAYTGLLTNSNTWPSPLTPLTDYQEDISYDPNGNIISYNRNGSASLPPPSGYLGGAPMDALHYKYYYYGAGNIKLPYDPVTGIPAGGVGTNQLAAVNDDVADNAYADDLDNQAHTDNYTYDKIGNLVGDKSEGNMAISWTVYGKIKHITKSDQSGTVTNIDYTYDASGNRISKKVNDQTTIYVRDAVGNVMSVYEEGNSNLNGGFITQSEVHLYGSTRLGIFHVNQDAQLLGLYDSKLYTFERGDKFFELSNHLGNVMATVTDKKLQQSADGSLVDYYTADIVTANDYYPGGMLMPGRKFAQSSSKYRYGFNGKENDNEVKGEGNQQDYGMRIYDPRLVKFLSVDPLTAKYPILYALPVCR